MQFATSSCCLSGFGISPRADALGGAYTAIADDGATYFYNPAGLGFLADVNCLCNIQDYTLVLQMKAKYLMEQFIIRINSI